MSAMNLILDGTRTPAYDEIIGFMNVPARDWWQDLNAFIGEKFKASPRIDYSKCSAKPGWNVKYQKSGKSICTLYPEKEGFVVLVVVLLELIPVIAAMEGELEGEVIALAKNAAAFNGTKWLMIQVNKKSVADSVKTLLLLKQQAAGKK